MKAIGIVLGSLLLLVLLLLMLVVALGEAMLHSVKPGTPISCHDDGSLGFVGEDGTGALLHLFA